MQSIKHELLKLKYLFCVWYTICCGKLPSGTVYSIPKSRLGEVYTQLLLLDKPTIITYTSTVQVHMYSAQLW